MQTRLILLALLIACVHSPPPPSSDELGDAKVEGKSETASEVKIKEFIRASAATKNPLRIGEMILSDGRRVAYNAYIERRQPGDPKGRKAAKRPSPSIEWADQNFLFENGVFVFEDPFQRGKVFFWNPPEELVKKWNDLCPDARFEKGHGFYGQGWYWGGVGSFGFHRYVDDPPDVTSEGCPPLKTPGGRPPTRPVPSPRSCQSDAECTAKEVCVNATADARGECRPRVAQG